MHKITVKMIFINDSMPDAHLVTAEVSSPLAHLCRKATLPSRAGLSNRRKLTLKQIAGGVRHRSTFRALKNISGVSEQGALSALQGHDYCGFSLLSVFGFCMLSGCWRLYKIRRLDWYLFRTE